MILALALVAQPASAPAPAPAPAVSAAERGSVSAAERWDLAVEVARPVPTAEAPLVAALPEVLSVRLDVYKDDGATLAYSTPVAPTVANPDWTASFSDGDAEWVELSWAALATAFLTVTLARYVYVPTACAYSPTQTGFHRPVAAGPA